MLVMASTLLTFTNTTQAADDPLSCSTGSKKDSYQGVLGMSGEDLATMLETDPTLGLKRYRDLVTFKGVVNVAFTRNTPRVISTLNKAANHLSYTYIFVTIYEALEHVLTPHSYGHRKLLTVTDLIDAKGLYLVRKSTLDAGHVPAYNLVRAIGPNKNNLVKLSIPTIKSMQTRYAASKGYAAIEVPGTTACQVLKKLVKANGIKQEKHYIGSGKYTTVLIDKADKMFRVGLFARQLKSTEPLTGQAAVEIFYDFLGLAPESFLKEVDKIY